MITFEGDSICVDASTAVLVEDSSLICPVAVHIPQVFLQMSFTSKKLMAESSLISV